MNYIVWRAPRGCMGCYMVGIVSISLAKARLMAFLEVVLLHRNCMMAGSVKSPLKSQGSRYRTGRFNEAHQCAHKGKESCPFPGHPLRGPHDGRTTRRRWRWETWEVKNDEMESTSERHPVRMKSPIQTSQLCRYESWFEDARAALRSPARRCWRSSCPLLHGS